jgi:hypothetical protein
MRQLVILVLTLVLVIYAMIEAGKPERWHWLIPPEQSQSLPGEKEPAEPQSPEKLKDDDKTRAAAQDAVPLRPLYVKRFSEIDASDYPGSAQQFWDRMVRRLTPQQRITLFQVLKRIRHGQPLNEDEQAAAQTLFNALHSQRVQFHQDLMNELTYSTEGTEKKSILANELFESETVWDRGEWPAISEYLSGSKLTDEQQIQLNRLQAILDPLVLGFVSDRTAQGWEGDSPAWGRLWEKILFQELPAPSPVTHLELSAQPASYRGQLVHVRGWIRGAWKEKLPIRELGIEHLFVAVVKPEDSKVTPYYMYVTQWPNEFPVVTQRYTPMNQRMVADGFFFKIRTYRDTENQIQNSPMILAKEVFAASEIEAVSVASFRWLHHPVFWLLLIVVLALAAVAIAWFAYYSNRTIRFQPGPNRTREIHEDLVVLADDPEIKTAREKVQELYE